MEISIESVESKFDQHLNLPQNNRILFSGKFGTGKSYFLKKYFENREDKYNLFWLSPVNYVVGANQDIFEWIKIDIAKELTSKDIFPKKEQNLTKNFLIQTYLYQNASTLFTELLTIVGDEVIRNKTGFSFLESFKKQIDNYKKFEAKANEDNKSEFEKINQYIKDSFQVKGSIFEDDLTTQILRASVSLLKYKTNKENVLVIDDLDRLDPEHIFRILNILSAHNDHFDTNKFGFDKVIVVCDIQNIQYIYEYKYGKDVDFDGYIEKFYTFEPYHYSIGDAVKYYCQKSISFNNLDRDSLNTLSYVLAVFYEDNKLKIRNLKKVISTPELGNYLRTTNKSFNVDSYTFRAKDLFKTLLTDNTIEIDYNDYGILKVIFILSNAFGDIYKLKSALQNLSPEYNYSIDWNYASSIVKSIGIMYHLAINGDRIDNNLFSIFDNGYGTVRLAPPTVNILNQRYEIYFGWSNSNKYKNGDYFKHSRLVLDNNSRDRLYNTDNKELFHSLTTIIDYIIKERLFDNIRRLPNL